MIDKDATRGPASNLPEQVVPMAPPTPQERLQASRLALQAWVTRTYHAESLPRTPESEPMTSDPGWLSVLADSLSDVPSATIAVRWVKRWWSHHPWRATADFASLAAAEIARPVATRHPWMLIGGAFLGGGLLVSLRPWRWISGGALLAGFLPHFSLTSILHAVTSTLSSLHPDEVAPKSVSDEHNFSDPPEPNIAV